MKKKYVQWNKVPIGILLDLAKTGIDPTKLKWMEFDHSEDDNKNV